MKLAELITRLQTIQDECNYGAHPYGENLDVKVWWMRDKDHDNELFDIVDLDVDTNYGCGCWLNAEIIIGKKEDIPSS